MADVRYVGLSVSPPEMMMSFVSSYFDVTHHTVMLLLFFCPWFILSLGLTPTYYLSSQYMFVLFSAVQVQSVFS